MGTARDPSGRAAEQTEIFLQPGEMYFGGSDTRIRTLLGSCVSVTAWHPGLRIGGMCHYMLTTRRGGKSLVLDGRYADEAAQWFQHEAARRETDLAEYEFKLFGGGDMFECCAETRHSVGRANASHAVEMLRKLGHRIVARHLGGSGHRTVLFDIATGDVWMRHVPLSVTREKAISA